ncbi:hypothetical protein A2U01_0078771, partial [Trifolium medium]|nr:hypothetical protein [Trifolium medium]
FGRIGSTSVSEFSQRQRSEEEGFEANKNCKGFLAVIIWIGSSVGRASEMLSIGE